MIRRVRPHTIMLTLTHTVDVDGWNAKRSKHLKQQHAEMT